LKKLFESKNEHILQVIYTENGDKSAGFSKKKYHFVTVLSIPENVFCHFKEVKKVLL